MSALTATSRSTQTSSDRLEDQAASAALYRDHETPSKQSSASVLDEDGRLSSASLSTLRRDPLNQKLTNPPGAAQSLRYARAQELPSFPSTGGVKLASAGAAASLADSNKKQFEHWIPGTIPAANQAAHKAKDYEMDPAWKPELSQAGSQAAMVAHKDTAPVDIWQAPETDQGASAASSALQNKKSPPAITNREVSTDNRQKALLAATMSMSRGRRRAESAPIKPAQPPPQASSSGWALKAAESSHQRKPSDASTRLTPETSGVDAARVQNLAKHNVDRQMYTANPPVAIEVEEKNRQDTLRASAIAMARKMYAIQQAQIDEAKGVRRSDSHYAANSARRRAQSDAANLAATPDEPAPRYENLEEAARRLAHERLSKLHDEHAEYRQYYGQQTPPPRSRLSLRRGRRSSSLREDSDSDEEQSRRIRAQMSLFQGKLADVDNKKRQADRDALLAIAHKNVTARMNAIDEQVFSETGKVTPQQREIWERQARERAQRESDERLMHAGKVHIGGGKYLEQSEIEEIAKARLQPTLDEITEKAEQQRARDEEIRLEQERLKAEQATEKQRQAETKAELKAAAEREKAEARARKEEEKRAQQEQKNAEKERQKAEKDEKRQSAGTKPRLLPSFLSKGQTGTGVADATAEPAGHSVHDKVTVDAGEGPHDIVAHEQASATTQKEIEEGSVPVYTNLGAKEDGSKPLPSGPDHPEEPTSPTSPSKRDSRVKSWFKKIRGGSRSDNELNDKPAGAQTETQHQHVTITSTDGAAEPTAKVSEEKEEGEGGKDMPRSDSMRDVALAGRNDNESDDMYGAPSHTDGRVSPLVENETNTTAAPATGMKTGPGPELEAVESLAEKKSASISSLSGSSHLSQEPHEIVADVASSRYSTDLPASSKEESGVVEPPAAPLSDTDESEHRGRKGFAERFLSKVLPGSLVPGLSHKEDDAAGTTTGSKEDAHAEASHKEEEAGHHANPEPEILEETEPLREKLDDPSTLASTSANKDDEEDDDFEEARDTFDEQRLGSSNNNNAKPSASPAGSRSSNATGTTGGREGSRFTEDL
ncbi:Eisosome assembly protein [Exophiala dermatitidis]|nr:Eisosome assembly protein [Exophiala dermatitidis]KAJ4580189.1 Eisosome assembly protein [Exophiala dermatitidis]KAJ4598371.1 Eisosome assembly protein [Exophiala dermatitidis]KAJ4600077.1 Eisosome assembly protein [Exophiala dermatitidis]KAJ4649891.1 Eisosome assembly protein [Exophiala dermatitidis]